MKKRGLYALLCGSIICSFTLSSISGACAEVGDTGRGDVTVNYVEEVSQERLDVKNSTIYIGSTWHAIDNIVKATDKNGKDVKATVAKNARGSVNTKKAGTYKVTYKNGSITKTVTITVKEKQRNEVVNVYRLYNKRSMEHLYTADAYEYKRLPEIAKDWVREGIAYKEYKKSDVTTEAIYRVYNPRSGEHIFTKNNYEAQVLKSKHGWRREGVAFYSPKLGGKPVYRLFNPKAGIGAHLFTADTYEKNVLTHAPKEWKYEGVAWRSVK